jgi:hypothetical protein
MTISPGVPCTAGLRKPGAGRGAHRGSRWAILPSRSGPANFVGQRLHGTGRHTVDSTRHTRKAGDGGQP